MNDEEYDEDRNRSSIPDPSTPLNKNNRIIGSPGLIEVLAQTATGPTPPCVRVRTGRFRSDTGFRPVVKTNPDGSEIGNARRFI